MAAPCLSITFPEDIQIKFSFILRSGETSIFYSGDCHEPPPAIVGTSVNALFAWPHPRDEAIVKLGQAIAAPLYVLMHGDHFEPGDFYCNFDLEHEKRRVESFVIPAEVMIE